MELELTFERFKWADKERVGPRRDSVDRFMFCVDGAIDVRSDGLSWFLPPDRGFWLPAGTEYEVRIRGGAEGYAVTLNGRFYGYPEQLSVFTISPMLRKMVIDSAERGRTNRFVDQMIVKKLQMIPYEGVLLPLVTTRRLQPVVEMVLDDPLNEAGIDDWAYRLNFDPYRMMRLFSRETGYSYQEWRHSARLMIAAEVLSAGGTLESAACEIGYRTPEALESAFRHTFGVSPEEYMDARLPARDRGQGL